MVILYDIVALLIFGMVSYTFLFPCNSIIPFDRRTVAIFGALLCYLTRTFIFYDDNHNRIDLISAVDFDVMVLLPSIMLVNHIIIHLKETKNVINYLQSVVQKNPIRGFWMVSLSAFLSSPFLTNDGVCLLFVEPILKTFDFMPGNQTSEVEDKRGDPKQSNKLKLNEGDAIYFLLALACSSNIGSSLTYTGNPQNMIVASDAIEVLPSYKFLCYMIIPSTLAWLLTIKWIEHSWLHSRLITDSLQIEYDLGELSQKEQMDSTEEAFGSKQINTDLHSSKETAHAPTLDTVQVKNQRIGHPFMHSLFNFLPFMQSLNKFSLLLPNSPTTSSRSPSRSPLSPRRRRAKHREMVIQQVVHIVTSPLPYVVLFLLGLMIIMIFVNIMPISALICLTAMVMILTIVLGNHWRGQPVWKVVESSRINNVGDHQDMHHLNSSVGNKIEEGEHVNTYLSLTQSIEHPENEDTSITSTNDTKQKKQDTLNEFFEELFLSIDYSLLLIFLGTFIVVENINSTGIPKIIWNSIIGKQPFKTVSSMLSISLFVILSSQLLGNVAVVQLIRPNVSTLDDDTKRFAWALISFVATIGGNLTITGSAANIIVAEKARKLDPQNNLDFFFHFRVCFFITLFVVTLGGGILACVGQLDNRIGNL